MNPLARRLPAALLGLAGCLLAGAPVLLTPLAAQAVGLPSTNVAWLPAAANADIDRAFAQARAQKKPVLLYWGATWCPPCNQLKATLFNRQDFAVQARTFVAVHIDGDRPGAQQLGARFKVVGYPTVILFTPEAAEITRLPGEVDAEQVMAVLQTGLAGGRPIQAVLADARAGRPVSANEWRLLAFYSWETDEGRLVPAAERAGLLAELAARSPAGDGETATRLWLKALAASDEGQGVRPDAGLRERVNKVLADPQLSRIHMDVLVNGAAEIVKVLSADDDPGRGPLAAAADSALARLQADQTLSRADRVAALGARVDLARLGQPKALPNPQIPAPLVQDVRALAARMDRETSDAYERQSVIPAVAYTLGQAGLWSESDALLQANLAKSHSPYYLMSQLGSNAKAQGRSAQALDWYAQAFDRSEGPATRLQWGSSYLQALVDLAPQDAARIERVAGQVFRQAAGDRSAFYERSARSLKRAGSKLASWNAGGVHAASLKRLQAQLDGVCAKVPVADGQRAACTGLLKAPAADKAG